MIVWLVLWDGDIKDICTSRENAIIAAKNFLETELEDTYVNVEELSCATCVKGYHHTIVIGEHETDFWV